VEEGGGGLDAAHRFREVAADRGPRGVRAARLALALALPLGACVAHDKPSAPAAPEGPRFRFVDVAGARGIDRVVLSGRPEKDHVLDSAGTGVAFLDYDKDGRLDVYVVNAWRLDGARVVERGKNALYRQRANGTFEDVTDAAGVGGEGEWGQGVAVADYDNDGWADLLVTNFGRNLLYRNRGDGTFQNVAPEAGIETPGWNTAAAFFDADGDGWLDLYIARYIDCSLEDVLSAERTLSWKGVEKVAFGPFGLKGAPDTFFRNVQGRFVDVTEAAGMTDLALGFGFAVRAFDADDDGDLDLYVANDSDPNYLYRNEGGGAFKEVGVMSLCAFDSNGLAQASMGLAAGDVDGDGVVDLFVNNFAEDFSTLYRGLGGGFFSDISQKSGVGPATFLPLSWGAAMEDLDNDGDLDLVVANGHIYPQVDRHPDLAGTYRQKNQLLENRSVRDAGAPEEPLFREVTDEAGPGFAAPRSYRGLAAGDFDNDGRMDLLVSALDEPPSLLRNEGRTDTWLTVVCEDPRGGTAPIGARVTVTVGGRRMTRDIASGDSYASSHDPRPHFGLGGATKADEVVVRWPDGTRSVRRNVPAGQFLVVRKGS
jgi:hypothetical protein